MKIRHTNQYLVIERQTFTSIFLSMVLLVLGSQCSGEQSGQFDWQGHRGARGLMPENTVPAFLKALEYPVKTLELDLVISADSQVVVSHEPWLSHVICTLPEGSGLLSEENERSEWNIFGLPYGKIRECDCGSKPHPGFPEQEKREVYKPLLSEVVGAVREYCEQSGHAFPFFNAEIKSRPEWDSLYTPDPATFVALVLAEIEALELDGHITLQSFDVRALQAIRAKAPDLPLAYLVESAAELSKNLELLGFTPEIYSPYHEGLNSETVSAAHAQGMQVIPWTVNETERMEILLAMGVDGIITDYPDKIP